MSTRASRRFPIRFTGANTLMFALGILRRWSFVEVGDDAIEVRFGWAFRATIPRAAVEAARADRDRVLGWGAHGWRGTWLVNGSSAGLVRVDIRPAARARVAGVPVALRVLRVSLEDPDGFVNALDT